MNLIQDLIGEVRYYIAEFFFIFVLTNVVLYVIYLAWRLSCRPTLGYNCTLIQTYQSASAQRVQIINADPERVNADDLVSLITGENNSTDQSTDSSSSDYNLRIRALVVRSPSRTFEPQSNNLSQDTTVVQLPLNANRHIAEIYQTIQHYTDSSIAGAVIVSLYRRFSRRLSNQNHLQISQLLSEVGSDANVASPSDQYAFTVNITQSEETTSTDSSTINSTMSSPTISDEAGTPTTETIQSNNEDPASQLPTNKQNQPEVATDGDDQTIRLKFLDDTEKIVRTKLTSTVLEFKKAHFPEQVLSGKTIRLIFRGQLLRDNNRSLESYGLQDNCIVHIHINNKPYAQAPSQSSNANNSNNSNEQPTFVNQLPQRPVFDEMSNESWFVRAMQMGAYYADSVPLIMFYAMSSSLTWIRNVENVQDDPGAPFATRQITRLRRCLFTALQVFVDFTEQPNVNEDMFANRFNLGVLFTLLFAVKFASIWLVVFYFPQYTDMKGIVILLILTIVFGLYTFQNRPLGLNGPQQGTNEIHIQ